MPEPGCLGRGTRDGERDEPSTESSPDGTCVPRFARIIRVNGNEFKEHMYRDTLDSVARFVHGRGLSVPAIFALELHKPLTGLASAAMVASRPLLHLVFGRNRFAGLEEILESSDRIEELIAEIERLDAVKKRGAPCKE